ncbi:MAG: 1-deoxy-D-xylulose-5-phosphate synthase [Acetobacteraceae bacterium]|nr:1-deoxy-D-xylulose-5-phosphate synthase [Acetobacteraceae bacterium]
MDGILDRVRGPDDIKALTLTELQQLAAEIRGRIIQTVARTGGHLAPNLGVVELALALHRVFSSPEDKLVWDVGHQTYAHKLITGRAEAFGSLRQYGGLSGFPRRGESPHDPFETGHASTSISAALGLARARDLAGSKHAVVAVIGDGAMTGGLAFEGLNNAGHMRTDLIVVLNDNSMSISRNVGALPSYLSRLRSYPAYSRLKADLERTLRRIPLVGERLRRLAERVKASVKYLVVPGMLFEELGFTYMGPIDGHHLPSLISVLQAARKRGGPVLVHVITRKGKGYAPAEANPDRFHGTGPFDLATGRAKDADGPPSYSEVFGRALVDLARSDPRVVAITAAMADGTGLSQFARLFPDRFFDVGIAEGHAVTFAAGLAAEGLRPVVAVYSTFLQRAYDNILHDVCLQDLPVVFAVDRAGVVGEDGPTHQGTFDLGYLRSMPHMVLMAPADEVELAAMLRTALECGHPAAVRYPRGHARGLELPEDLSSVPALDVGRGQVLAQGKDLAILAVGTMVHPAVEAARSLAGAGVGAAVVNVRFIKPLDEGLILGLARATGCLLTVEENAAPGGFGGAVLELLAQRAVDGVRVGRLDLGDGVVSHGPARILLEERGLSARGIADAARLLLASRRGDAPRQRLPGEEGAGLWDAPAAGGE